MSHELNVTAKGVAMFYAGRTPWHGLGQKLDKPATSAEAIAAARLDYVVDTTPVQYETPAGVLTMPGQHVTYRTDNDVALGVVGKSYRVIQNTEAFGFMDALAGDGSIEYHTAGALRKGQTVWMLAQLPGVIKVGADDVTEKYLILTNSHDGSSRLMVWWTPVRVVCSNTLKAAMDGRRSEYTAAVSHSGDVAGKLKEAQRVLGLATTYFDDLEAAINHLSGIQFTADAMQKYVQTLLPVKDEGNDTRRQGVRDKIVELMDSPANRLEGIRGTAWAAYNAVAEYADHHKNVRTFTTDKAAEATRLSKERRFDSVLFGAGADLKRRGWKLILQQTS